jgi:hypothetical protein
MSTTFVLFGLVVVVVLDVVVLVVVVRLVVLDVVVLVVLVVLVVVVVFVLGLVVPPECFLGLDAGWVVDVVVVVVVLELEVVVGALAALVVVDALLPHAATASASRDVDPAMDRRCRIPSRLWTGLVRCAAMVSRLR